MIVQDGFSTYRYEYEDELHSMKWELLDNVSKEIAGYKVFQAKTKWRGRIWTVWFTPEEMCIRDRVYLVERRAYLR